VHSEKPPRLEARRQTTNHRPNSHRGNPPKQQCHGCANQICVNQIAKRVSMRQNKKKHQFRYVRDKGNSAILRLGALYSCSQPIYYLRVKERCGLVAHAPQRCQHSRRKGIVDHHNTVSRQRCLDCSRCLTRRPRA